ncbi:MAG: PH domain-containing protein [Candidatus Nomurabacteria bacterium]|nr:MAG: PH domain-containing protein [Candidatus Nomurabacteria bacterium]
MLDSYISKNLKDGETVLRIVKQFPFMVAFRLSLLGIVLLLDFFFLTFFIQRGTWGFLLFCLVLLAVIFFSWRQWYMWSMNVLLITNQRIVDIDQRGFFDRTVSETTYRRIQDVSYSSSGIFATLFHYGRIVIQTAGTQTRIELAYIKNPEHVQDLITHLQDESALTDRAKSQPEEGNHAQEI